VSERREPGTPASSERGPSGPAAKPPRAESVSEHDHAHHPEPLAPVEARVAAIESVLIEQGLFATEQLDAIVENFEHNLGPLNGAKVVARAWTDPEYKARLLDDGTAAIAELGFGGAEGDHMVVVENTPLVHNLVVCTLCSCYPWPTLGLPPNWYKSPAYRSRAVREPRVLLAEMGTDVADDVEIRVWDSSAEVRYLVLPQRPEGTERLSEAELAALVTRDSMIGVERL
jgi:nitrile hydratase subunit alpha